jgi:folate-binding protein YgfZ
MMQLTALPDRGVLAVEGEDRVAFLQGLVSNDIEAAHPGTAVWAALLTAQGKWLADFFVFSHNGALLLDCEAEQVPFLAQRLSRYRLRMKVSLRSEPSLFVHVAWNGRPDAERIVAPNVKSIVGPDAERIAPPEAEAIVAPDPRLFGFAWRVLSPHPLASNATPEDWDRHRLEAGLPDGSKDMEADRSVLLEAGFDELSGVSWSKGCYMGQELTARTKYRGLVKRRLIPVSVDGPLPPPGSAVLRDGIEVGTMRSGRDRIGLASIRLDALAGTLRSAGATLVPAVPGWMRLPEKAG